MNLPASTNQVEVLIMGQSYVLSAPPEGQNRLRRAVSQVDGAMCKIRDAGKVRARDRIAVLAALNLAFESQGTATTGADHSNTATPSSLSSDVRIDTLISRIDAALAGDGQLI